MFLIFNQKLDYILEDVDFYFGERRLIDFTNTYETLNIPQNRCSLKFSIVHRKAPALVSLYSKTGVFL